MDQAKKPEWYRRQPQTRSSTEVGSSYRTRSRTAASYNSLSSRLADNSVGHSGVFQLHPEEDPCEEVEECSELMGSYRDTTLSQGLGLYDTGVHRNMWHPGFYDEDQAESPVPDSSGAEESDSDSDVIFLVSTSKDSLLCSSLSRDSISPIVEPLSPAALSLDEGRGCFLLPQTLSSPSPDSTYSEESSDSSVDIPLRHTRPVVVLSGLTAVYRNPVDSPVEVSSDDSDVIEVPVTESKKSAHTFTDNSSQSKIPSDEENFQNQNDGVQGRPPRRSARLSTSVPLMDTFIDNVSHRYSTRQAKSCRVSSYKECSDSDDMIYSTERLSSSEEESPLQPAPSKRESTDSDDSDSGTQTDRKSPSKTPRKRLSKILSHSQPCQSNHAPPQITNKQKTKTSHPAPKGKNLKTKQNVQQRMSVKQHPKVSTDSKTAVNKKAVKRRRRKKQTQSGPSSFFPPQEPEIKLKFANKKEKRDTKSDNFRPFVHVEHTECTVVNYEEDQVSVRRNRGRQQTGTCALTGFIPKTSCFHPGRLSQDSKCQSMQTCCLCGEPSNTMGLGDLHGPYYPTNLSLSHREQNGRATSPEDRRDIEKEEDQLHVDMDRNGETADEGCVLLSDSEVSSKKPPVDAGNRSVMVSPHRDERWIHEDCGIWSAGVFLVKGKLYGLEEAARLAQETVCSMCNERGATMGCFQKGCLMNYHYRCAIQSGCVMNEENFSMRCPKHKNTPVRSLNRKHNR